LRDAPDKFLQIDALFCKFCSRTDTQLPQTPNLLEIIKTKDALIRPIRNPFAKKRIERITSCNKRYTAKYNYFFLKNPILFWILKI